MNLLTNESTKHSSCRPPYVSKNHFSNFFIAFHFNHPLIFLSCRKKSTKQKFMKRVRKNSNSFHRQLARRCRVELSSRGWFKERHEKDTASPPSWKNAGLCPLKNVECGSTRRILRVIDSLKAHWRDYLLSKSGFVTIRRNPNEFLFLFSKATRIMMRMSRN